MHTSIILSALSGLALVAAQKNSSVGVTGSLGHAAIVTDNPQDVVYTAKLPESSKSRIRGYITGKANDNGVGVIFEVKMTGFELDKSPDYCMCTRTWVWNRLEVSTS